MPWWAWLVGTIVPIWAAYRLVRASKTGRERFGPFFYDRIADPAGFWFFVLTDAFVLVFVGGLIGLVAAKELFRF